MTVNIVHVSATCIHSPLCKDVVTNVKYNYFKIISETYCSSWLRSASSHELMPPFRLTTVGRQTFPVAASLLWNSL